MNGPLQVTSWLRSNRLAIHIQSVVESDKHVVELGIVQQDVALEQVLVVAVAIPSHAGASLRSSITITRTSVHCPVLMFTCFPSKSYGLLSSNRRRTHLRTASIYTKLSVSADKAANSRSDDPIPARLEIGVSYE